MRPVAYGELHGVGAVLEGAPGVKDERRLVFHLRRNLLPKCTHMYPHIPTCTHFPRHLLCSMGTKYSEKEKRKALISNSLHYRGRWRIRTVDPLLVRHHPPLYIVCFQAFTKTIFVCNEICYIIFIHITTLYIPRMSSFRTSKGANFGSWFADWQRMCSSSAPGVRYFSTGPSTVSRI